MAGRTSPSLPAPSPDGALVRAIIVCDRLAARAALEAGADPNFQPPVRRLYVDSHLRTMPPIRRAVNADDYEMARLLLEHGADVNGLCRHCEQPALTIAVVRGDVAFTGWLLRNGADPDTRLDKPSHFGPAYTRYRRFTRNHKPALLLAATFNHPEVVKLLLGAGAAVDRVTGRGTSALRCAVIGEHLECAKLLLEAGANADLQNIDGATALMVCCAAEKPAFVRLLLKHGADPNIADCDGTTPLMLAAKANHEDIAEQLLDHGAGANAVDHDGHTALIVAAMSGSVDSGMLLFERGADLDTVSRDEHWYGTALMTAISMLNPAFALMLLAHGADPNVGGDFDGYTALHIAAECELPTVERLKLVEFLMMCGADALRNSDDDFTPAGLADSAGNHDVAACIEQCVWFGPLWTAVACRNALRIKDMLEFGVPGPDSYLSADFVGIVGAPAGALWPGSLGPCDATTALVKKARSCWSPGRHNLYHREVRVAIYAVLLAAARLDGPMTLPGEIWHFTCSFFRRSDWPVDKPPTRDMIPLHRL